MTKVLRVADGQASPVARSSMIDQGLTEPGSLEPWLVQHIEVIDPTLKVVATQFNRWASGAATAVQRLDILALARSGELVVIELKRGWDKNIHIQAISYGALVAGFTIATVAEVHADWLGKSGQNVTASDAESALRDHVDEEWTEEILQQTRLILVAESFPALVLTTIQWLALRAPELKIECHEYALFPTEGSLMIAFDRLYPVNDLSDQVLVPTANPSSAAAKVARTQKQAKSVVRIHQLRAIPMGAPLTLELATHVKPALVAKVNEWLDGDPKRREFSWVDDAHKPLLWGADPSVAGWTPSRLRDHIFESAGLQAPNFSAADAWSYNGQSLYEVANSAEASDGM